ncbi:radical SAM/SPASM domain-containing protein [Pseudovibrio sp. JE062]|uniref:radical SAM/SPASM domain-containing protein n=1 Tax=Pseudovibrio sp. JE062 TaxID=439495 RepID=UPI000186BF41|nr:radical SAM/SPASM domain-containing protein [Pseudovibrio sp. JE062]EEA94885.1 radical SAM domain protein [Pseudovibrio sp. JE062]
MSSDVLSQISQSISDPSYLDETSKLEREAVNLLVKYAQYSQLGDQQPPLSGELLVQEAKQFLKALSEWEDEFGELDVLYKAARKEIGVLRSKVMKERLQKANLQRTNNILKQAFILSTEMRDEHLSEVKDLAFARELFVSTVKMVEIEVFSYCNRVCWFCPNAIHDRRSANHHMKHETYIKILEDLRSCDFDKRISFSRYNEPLADQSIVDRLAEARSYLPKAILHINTNGDYLHEEYLSRLYEAGLRSLNVQIYLNNEEKYDHGRVRQKLERRVSDLGLSVHDVKDIPNTWLEVAAPYRDMKLRMYGRNFDVNGCDRGGTVEVHSKSPRVSPCRSPFYHMYIDYNGSVMPCCNVRSDVPEHRQCKLGVMSKDTSLFEIYAGSKAASWRRAMVGFRPKEGVCKNCNFKEFTDSIETRKAQESILKTALDLEKTI